VAERLPGTLSDFLIHDADSADELAARLLCWRDGATEFRERARRVGATLRTRSWDEMSREIADLAES